MSKTLIRLPDVIGKTGLSRSTIYLRMRQGTFPQSISIGSRSAAWVEEDIIEWIEDCIQKRRSISPPVSSTSFGRAQ